MRAAGFPADVYFLHRTGSLYTCVDDTATIGCSRFLCCSALRYTIDTYLDYISSTLSNYYFVRT